MISNRHWSPGSDVSVQSVERSDAGGWLVSGTLVPQGICAQTVVCMRDDVTDGGIGGCRIFPHMEAGSQ